MSEPSAASALRAEYLQILEFYQNLLDTVSNELSLLGYSHTSRVKTLGTLVEKLTRDPTTKLTRVNDVAGIRIVTDGGRQAQDDLVDRICKKLNEIYPRNCSIIDRRDDPRSGYRAVHIVAYPQNHPVEIQVRTRLQDMWAQIYEGLADRWGREIRYGGSPLDPAKIVHIPGGQHEFHDPQYQALVSSTLTRERLVRMMELLSGLINSVELIEKYGDRLRSIAEDLNRWSNQDLSAEQGALLTPGNPSYEVLAEYYESIRSSYHASNVDLSGVQHWDDVLVELDGHRAGDPISAAALRRAFALNLEFTNHETVRKKLELSHNYHDVSIMLQLISESSASGAEENS